jgi:hypothetical protein
MEVKSILLRLKCRIKRARPGVRQTEFERDRKNQTEISVLGVCARSASSTIFLDMLQTVDISCRGDSELFMKIP